MKVGPGVPTGMQLKLPVGFFQLSRASLARSTSRRDESVGFGNDAGGCQNRRDFVDDALGFVAPPRSQRGLKGNGDTLGNASR